MFFSTREYHAQYWRSLYLAIEPTFNIAGDKIIKLSPFFSILLITSSIWSITVLSIRRYWPEGKKILISVFHILLIFLCIELIVLLGWSGYLGVGIISSLPQILFNIFKTVSEILIFVLITISVGNGLGAFLCKKVKYNPDLSKTSLLLISFCLGVALIYFIAYPLALFGILNTKIVFGLLITSLALYYKKFSFWFKSFFEKNISFAPPISFFDLRALSFILLLIFIARNFLQLSSPIPIGFDESTQYINTVNLIAQNGHLISGIPAFPWELYLSTAEIIFKSVSLARYITFSCGIFVLLAIFLISKFYLEKRQLLKGKEEPYSLLAVLIFYSLPIVMFHSSRDMKVDIPSLLFSLASLFLFWKWIFSGRLKKDIYLLLISSFFLGFAFAIKYSSLFFCIGIFIPFAISFFIGRKKQFIQKIFISSLIFLCFASTIIPFVIKNSFENRTILPYGENSNFLSFDKYLNKLRGKTAENETMLMFLNNVEMELGRYNGNGSLKSKILIPITMTNNSNIQGNYVDIGFFFLAIVPLLILFYRPIKKEFPKNFFLLNQLLIIFLGTYLLWLWKGKAVIWYGIAIFPLMLFLSLEIQNYLKKFKALKMAVNITIICWLILVFAKTQTSILGEITQNNLTIVPLNIEYLKGTADQTKFIEYYHEGKSQEEKIVNDKKLATDKIYLIDPFLKYYIKNNDHRCFNDQYLVQFAYLSQDQGTEGAIKQLKENGFELIVYDYYSVINFTNSSELDSFNRSLWKFLRDNPDKIELLRDDPFNGIVVGKIL